jgi:hypothetical protein
MRRFYLLRNEDPTGNSGTGRVAEGCLFSDGTAVIRWINNSLNVRSSVFYSSLADAEKVHGHGGLTVIEWVDSLTIGDVVNINSFEGFGGLAKVVDYRPSPGSRFKVEMLNGSEPQPFWAHDFEIEELRK